MSKILLVLFIAATSFVGMASLAEAKTVRHAQPAHHAQKVVPDFDFDGDGPHDSDHDSK